MESGAADKVVRRFLAVFGERGPGRRCSPGSYVISIPIFFDTLFMLLLPLARAMGLRTGKDYLLSSWRSAPPGVVTHSLVRAASRAVGDGRDAASGLGPLDHRRHGRGHHPGGRRLASWRTGSTVGCDIPLRETPGAPLAELEAIVAEARAGTALVRLVHRCRSSCPSSSSRSPPVRARRLRPARSRPDRPRRALPAWLVEFIGNRNVALLLGTVIAMGVLMRQRGLTVARVCELIGPPLETAGRHHPHHQRGRRVRAHAQERRRGRGDPSGRGAAGTLT